MKLYKRAYIEITNICNLACSFCPIDQRQAESMNIEKYEKIIKQVSPLTEQVCLHLMGEPLAHQQITEILEISNKYEAKIQLTTNGLLLKKYQDLLISSNCIRQINISLQSYMDNYPQKNMTEYLDMIYLFIKSIQENRPDIYLNLRLWNLVEDKEQWVNEVIFKYFEEKLNIIINRTVDTGSIKSKKIAEKLYLHFDSRFEWPRMELPFQGMKGRCNALNDHLAIHADGTVVPCCLDDQKIINLGNILDKPIEEIINSTRAKAMKNGFQSGVLVEDLCQRCTYINRFKK